MKVKLSAQTGACGVVLHPRLEVTGSYFPWALGSVGLETDIAGVRSRTARQSGGFTLVQKKADGTFDGDFLFLK